MKACLICPVPDLERYVDEKATHHLLLSHCLDIPGYVEFYRERAAQGNYLILDNGAKEMGVGQRMEDVLLGAAKVGAKEVVLTDVRYKAALTVRSAQSELAWMASLDGRIAYDNAGCPKLMIVPQGTNEAQWHDCLKALIELVDDFRAVVEDMPEPCVAFAYHYDHLFRGGLPKLLTHAKTYQDIHMLGWPRSLITLDYISGIWNLRSVDSGKPFSYAKAGQHCHPGTRYAGRDENFFTEPMPKMMDEITRSNIAVFRRMAGDA